MASIEALDRRLAKLETVTKDSTVPAIVIRLLDVDRAEPDTMWLAGGDTSIHRGADEPLNDFLARGRAELQFVEGILLLDSRAEPRFYPSR